MAKKLSRLEAERRLIGRGLPFELLELEIRGVKTRVWRHAPVHLGEVFAATAGHTDADYIVLGPERLTYAEHYTQVCHFAGVLAENYGIAKGDRVAIAMRNLPEWSVAFWAVVSLGAIAVPLNAWLTGRELAFCLDDCGARVAVADGKRAAVLAPHIDSLDLAGVIVTRAGESREIAGAAQWEALMAGAAESAQPAKVPIDPEDDATIFYTSGTTGEPKGALGTHRNICSNIMTVNFRGAMKKLRNGDLPESLGGEKTAMSVLAGAPFFHVTGCHSTLAPALNSGAKTVILRRWNPEKALGEIERESITNFVGVPGMALQLAESPNFSDYDTASLISIGFGGAPSPLRLQRRLAERFPQATAEVGYGLTEVSSVATFISGEDYEAKPDSVGHTIPTSDIRIVGENGADLAAGEKGEICLRGPNVVKGYWRNPEASAETFDGGWMRTGDIGLLDDDGCLFVLDRAKDMLLRGGENIYCVEIENALYRHPAVMEAAVIGRPHDILGEEVVAIVQIMAGTCPSEGDLIEYCARHLAPFKVPVQIDIRNEALPSGASGKILKKELQREMFPEFGK
ncbi:MAG: class I adenylate-forming enzyme family protein [Rhodospirillales bacterium]|jgi:long-chain acyl-CoA synthetase|nr:class I adenylate-forming enzyme family protein [Alphaproteobacteria bacterium]MDP6842393.1 class I adenylate-forming enzyme family protein [Rhodospirillales bacterium]